MGGCGMLRVYCHYSYAGYKLYNLTKEGIKEITSSDRYGISQASITFFSRYGLKEAFLPLPDGSWMLLVHDIPSNELDDMGRKKTCSLQVIATNREEKRQLARASIIIANGMSTFHQYFASMWSIKDELSFDYNAFQKLFNGLGAHNEMMEFDKPWDRVYEQGAPLILYNGSSLMSSISDIKHLINKNDVLRSVNIKWSTETNAPSSMKVSGRLYDIIQRILDKLNIWND